MNLYVIVHTYFGSVFSSIKRYVRLRVRRHLR